MAVFFFFFFIQTQTPPPHNKKSQRHVKKNCTCNFGQRLIFKVAESVLDILIESLQNGGNLVTAGFRFLRKKRKRKEIRTQNIITVSCSIDHTWNFMLVSL
jgi:hypothetical protein